MQRRLLCILLIITTSHGVARGDADLLRHMDEVVSQLETEKLIVDRRLSVTDCDVLVAESRRGEVFVVEGRLDQTAIGPFGDAVVLECWVRLAPDRPILILIPGATTSVESGATVMSPAAYLGTIDRTARDGEQRTYPVFVGAWIDVKSMQAPLWPAMLLIGLMVLVYVVVVVVVKHTRRPTTTRLPGDVPAADGAELPSDAASALAELRRRADELT